MINKVFLAGEITREIKMIKLGDKLIINFIILTLELNKKLWHRIILYNNLANIFKNKLKKHQIILLEGKISNRKWLNNNNKYNYITEIIADKITIIKNKEEEIIKNDNSNINSEESFIKYNKIYINELLEKEEIYEEEINKNIIERDDGYENEI